MLRTFIASLPIPFHLILRNLKSVFIAMVLTLFAGIAVGQVTTNGGSGLSATYPSLANAVTALNAATISSPVVITVQGNETAPAGGYVITASGTATNTVVINGGGKIITAGLNVAGSANDAIIKLLGADWVTIENFVMQENPSNTLGATIPSHTLTEWGIALLYETATDGAQNCTIQNNAITMRSGYGNWGIYSNSTHTSTNVTTTASATGSTGGNDGLKIYGNTIKNARFGITIVGPTAADDFQTGIDIGGNTPAKGNKIEFGSAGFGSGTTGAYANAQLFTTPQASAGAVVYHGIMIRNCKGANISNNEISSPNPTLTGYIAGLFIPTASNTPSGTYTTTINSNTFDLFSSALGGQPLNAIELVANALSNTSALDISDNTFQKLEFTGLGTGFNGDVRGIKTNCATFNTTINRNSFNNLETSTARSFFCINTNFAIPAGGRKEINDNIGDGITMVANASGVALIRDDATTSPTGTVTEIKTNTFTNIKVANTVNNPVVINAIYCFDGGTQLIMDNAISSFSGAASAVYALWAGNGNPGTEISGNTIYNITVNGTIAGIQTGGLGTGGDLISGNKISGLKSTGGSSYWVYGIRNSQSPKRTFEKNSICDLEQDGGGSVIGIQIQSGGEVIIQNNVIGDLRSPLAADDNSVMGISIESSTATAVKLYHNTIRLNAISTGTNFGSSVISSKALPTLDLKNNILVNLSKANGLGYTVLYRTLSTTLSTYGAASDRNLFYAGPTAGNRFIYYNYTNKDLTLSSFQTRLGDAREDNSVSENPTFLDTTCGASFLRIDPSVTSKANGAADVIPGITDDIDGDLRDANNPDMGADEFNQGGAPVPSVPAAPTALSATAGNGQLQISFTAGDDGGAAITNYEYSTDGGTTWVAFNPAKTTSPVTITGLTNGTAYSVKLRAVNSAGSGAASTSVSGTPCTTPTASITPSGATTFCSGGSVTLTASGGSEYLWSTGATTASINVTTSGTYTVTVKTGSCSATASETVTVSSNETPSVTIVSSDLDNNICIGKSVTFTATTTAGGSTPSYQWKLNDNNVGTNQATYTTTTLNDGDVVKVVMTSSLSCATTSTVTSSSITTLVKPVVASSVVIASSDADNEICAGTSVTFTATPTNGGNTPSYQWLLNDVNVGEDAVTFTTTSLNNGDVVKVLLKSSVGCTLPFVSSSGITTKVNPKLTPSVSLSSSDADNAVAPGTNVTFTATPTNGGSTPAFQWKLNDAAVGTNSATYSNANLVDGDKVKVVLTSSESCVTNSKDSATVTMKVFAPPTGLTYTPSTFVLTKGSAMTAVTPTYNGDPATGFTISPALPAGMSFNTTTGRISGTPTVLQTTAVEYTITITNEGGSATTKISLTVNDVAPGNLNYNPASVVATKGTAITAVNPTSSGGAVVSYSISPSLPAGMSINTTTGQISGTPTVLQTTAVSYTITATNSGGSTTATFSLKVNDAPPGNLTFSPATLVATKGQAITVINPSSTGGTVVSYSINPALPAGMSFNTTTGQISGTPTVLQTTAVTYTITATNSGGSTTTTFSLTVNDVPPSNLTYTPASQRATRNVAINAMSPSAQGGPVVSYAISPALPAGLSFNTTTGVISGTLTAQLSGTVEYTVTATNSGGSTTSKVTIIYNTPPNDLGLSKSNLYEANQVGDQVGTLSTVDIDAADTHTYSLVSGIGGDDNAAFTISGNKLLAAQVFNFKSKSTYTIRLRTTDNGGLSFDKVVQISISELPVLNGKSSDQYGNTISANPVVSKGYSTQLQIAGSGIASVSWSPTTGLSNPNILNPIAKPSVTTTYTVTITNSFGSVTTIKITVEVKEDYLMFPNNILTPNYDGYNDYWVVQNLESYPDNDITIYDRNGKILFKAANYNNRWDGTVDGRPLATGTYYYIIRFRNKPSVIFKGFITVIHQ